MQPEIDDIQKRASEAIAALEAEIITIKNKINTIRHNAANELESIISKTPDTKQRIMKLSWAQFFCEAVKPSVIDEIAKYYGIKKQDYAGIMTFPCGYCGRAVRIVVKSRTAAKEAFKHSYTCDTCKAEQSEQYRAQTIAEQEHLEKLREMPYAEYLKTAEWQNFRKAVLKRAHYKCQLCNAGGELHVHHNNYDNRGNELYSDVIVLCKDCHTKFHGKGVCHE